MRTIKMKAVVCVTNDTAQWFIHGSNDETTEQMFKAVTNIWNFDPATETAHVVEVEVTIPDFEKPIENDTVV